MLPSNSSGAGAGAGCVPCDWRLTDVMCERAYSFVLLLNTGRASCVRTAGVSNEAGF